MSFTLTGLSSNAQSMFSKLGNDAFKGGFKNPNIASAVGGVIQNFGSFIPEKSVYGGTNGDITRTADSIYDTASDVVSSIPGLQGVGLLAKGVGVLSKGVAALGGGTDAMTKTDALLGSNFFQLTPMGLINGFFGKRSHTLDNGEAEQEAIAGSGSSYTGSVHQWQDAAKYSNKKYGMFSSGARKRANRKIDAANRTMDIIEGINTTAQNNLERANTMADTYNMAYQMNLNGGYDPTTQIGRNGLKIQYLKRAKKIVNKMKDQKHFNSKDDKLQDKKEISSHKNGGVLIEEFFNPTDWQPIISINSIEKFQNGGSVNVIPDGALHARLHHMEDAKDLTKKGIPVVDNNGNQ